MGDPTIPGTTEEISQQMRETLELLRSLRKRFMECFQDSEEVTCEDVPGTEPTVFDIVEAQAREWQPPFMSRNVACPPRAGECPRVEVGRLIDFGPESPHAHTAFDFDCLPQEEVQAYQRAFAPDACPFDCLEDVDEPEVPQSPPAYDEDDAACYLPAHLLIKRTALPPPSPGSPCPETTFPPSPSPNCPRTTKPAAQRPKSPCPPPVKTAVQKQKTPCPPPAKPAVQKPKAPCPPPAKSAAQKPKTACPPPAKYAAQKPKSPCPPPAKSAAQKPKSPCPLAAKSAAQKPKTPCPPPAKSAAQKPKTPCVPPATSAAQRQETACEPPPPPEVECARTVCQPVSPPAARRPETSCPPPSSPSVLPECRPCTERGTVHIPEIDDAVPGPSWLYVPPLSYDEEPTIVPTCEPDEDMCVPPDMEAFKRETHKKYLGDWLERKKSVTATRFVACDRRPVKAEQCGIETGQSTGIPQRSQQKSLIPPAATGRRSLPAPGCISGRGSMKPMTRAEECDVQLAQRTGIPQRSQQRTLIPPVATGRRSLAPPGSISGRGPVRPVKQSDQCNRQFGQSEGSQQRTLKPPAVAGQRCIPMPGSTGLRAPSKSFTAAEVDMQLAQCPPQTRRAGGEVCQRPPSGLPRPRTRC